MNVQICHYSDLPPLTLGNLLVSRFKRTSKKTTIQREVIIKAMKWTSFHFKKIFAEDQRKIRTSALTLKEVVKT
jgi:hypothetical protein